ncbi:MAG: glycosyltransferase [Bacteroidetes bacterium]|nr:glycosyltransferase [Bacteroidota bacterium]MDA1268352.1 glycosyltransferase [Bacteroidota bacterium]
MAQVLVITPVKNAIETTLDTARAIAASSVKVKHVIFNDFSTAETKDSLEKHREELGYDLIHIEDLTDHPSPNYKLVLQLAQQQAMEAGIPLLVVESDVVIAPNTIQSLLDHLAAHPSTGLVGSVTVDDKGEVNFPYLKFKGVKDAVIDTQRSLSFCCTLFSTSFLQAFDFKGLDEAKDWYDTFISKKSVELGFKNTVLMNAPVWHRPHASRPWKQLKYSNPLKYYFLKFWKGLDKI